MTIGVRQGGAPISGLSHRPNPSHRAARQFFRFRGRHALIILVVLLLGAGLVEVARAGVDEWTSGGPEGGVPLTLAIDPRASDVLYAGTFAGGAFKSTTGGKFWTPINTGLQSSAVRAIAIDPQNTMTLYATNGGAGIFKSSDGGANWNASNAGLPFPNGIDLASAVAVDPQTPATVYLGTGTARFEGGRVFKTTNGGAAWVESVTTGATITSIVIDPVTPATVYAASFGGGVLKTVNGGASWSPTNTGLVSPFVYVLVVDPLTSGTLYAGTGSGVFKSTDGGATWSDSGTGITYPVIGTIAIDPQTPATLYAGTYTGTAGVFKSTNGGATWSPINDGLSKLSIIALAVNPQRPTTLFAGTEGGGVFKTTNGGGRWDPSNAAFTGADVRGLALHAEAAGVVYAGTGGGMFKSTSGGASWVTSSTGITDTFINAVAVDPLTPATLYAATSESSVSFVFSGLHIGTGGVFKSVDGGGSWSERLRAPDAVTTVVIDPQTPATLYAGAGFGGVVKSTDGGTSWRPSNVGLPFPSDDNFVLALAIDPQIPNIVYAGTGTAGPGTFIPTAGKVFKSINGGASWNEVLPVGAAVKALAIDPSSSATLYAGTFGAGVFKSLNSGGTWSPSNAGLTDLSVNALMIEPRATGTLYAGTNGTGVFKSVDGGATWSPNNAGLEVRVVPSLALDPSGTCLHAGTGGRVFDFAKQIDSGCPSPPSLLSAVLPASRSVQVGQSATAFATIANPGVNFGLSRRSVVDTGIAGLTCGITQLSGPPVPFTFQATDPATNQPIGTPNTPVNIAPGSNQAFVISLTPTAGFCPVNIQFGFNCTNASSAASTVGLNTLLVTASPIPVPDVIALAATINNDGIVNIPGPTGTGVFVVATTNLGVGATMTVSTDTGDATMPVTVSICETDPVGQCLSSPVPSVTRVINQNDTPTFGVFVTGTGPVPFDPAHSRVFVRFKEDVPCGPTNEAVTRGATSVAVRTQ